eukprot:jgi/Tetstr1/464034/TSEL_008839.t1
MWTNAANAASGVARQVQDAIQNLINTTRQQNDARVDPIDFNLLTDWANESESNEAAAPAALKKWLEKIKKRRADYRQQFVRWRETTLFKAVQASMKNDRNWKEHFDQHVRDAVGRAIADDFGAQAYDTLMRDIPAEHQADFSVYLAWLVSRQDMTSVPGDVILVSYLMLIKGVTLWSIAPVRNDARNWFFRGLAYPLKVLDKLGFAKSGQRISDRMIDKQIRFLNGFGSGEPTLSPAQRYDMAMMQPDPDVPTATLALRDLLVSRAHAFNSILSRLPGKGDPALLTTVEEYMNQVDEIGAPPLWFIKDDAGALGVTALGDQPLDEAMKEIQKLGHKRINDLFSSKRDPSTPQEKLDDDMRMVMAAYVNVMLAYASMSGRDDKYAREFAKATAWFDGNMGDHESVKRMYMDMLKNPFVKYGPEFTIPKHNDGGSLFDVKRLRNIPGPVQSRTVYGGNFERLLARLKSIAQHRQAAAPKNEMEQYVLSNVRAMLDSSVMDTNLSAVIGEVLTYKFRPETIWALMHPPDDLDAEIREMIPESTPPSILRGTILKIGIRHLKHLIQTDEAWESMKLKNLRFEFKQRDAYIGAGSEGVEYTLLDEDGELNESSGLVRVDERDGEPYLVLDGAVSDIQLIGLGGGDGDGDGDGAASRVVHAIRVIDKDTMVSQARQYVWETLADEGTPTNTNFAAKIETIRDLLDKEETKKMGTDQLLPLLDELRGMVTRSLVGRQDANFADLANHRDFDRPGIDGQMAEAALINASGRAEARLQGVDYEDTDETDKSKVEKASPPKGDSRIKRGIRWIKEGTDALGSAVKKSKVEFDRVIDDTLGSVVVGRSPVCSSDGTKPTALQKLMENAADNADRYLASQYQMFGMWGLFNIMLIAVLFYLLYKIWQVLFQYYQFRSEASSRNVTPGSNNIFDPADDDDDWKPKASDIAKRRVPSGAAIESRLRRYSNEGGMNLGDAIDSSKDKYPKPDNDEDEDDDY